MAEKRGASLAQAFPRGNQFAATRMFQLCNSRSKTRREHRVALHRDKISDLKHVQQIDELVADEACIETEKYGQDDPGPHEIEHSQSGQKYEHKNAEAGQQQLGCSKRQRAFAKHQRHDWIDFDRTTIEQLQREESIHAAQ